MFAKNLEMQLFYDLNSQRVRAKTREINEKVMIWLTVFFTSVQFNSVTQSCPTLCNPMNHSTPGFLSITNSWSSLRLMSTELVVPSSHLILYRPLLAPSPQSLPASGSFPMSQLFAWGGQSIGVSASASVLPVNTQDWSPLGWTGWIPLQSKGLQESSPTSQKSWNLWQFFYIRNRKFSYKQVAYTSFLGNLVSPCACWPDFSSQLSYFSISYLGTENCFVVIIAS